MKWKLPPIIKVYESLGAIGDERIEVKGNAAKVYSSSRNKFYEVFYDPDTKSIMANDNGSYWQGYLGYPAIAFLMKQGIVSYDPVWTITLKDIPWKDLNTQFQNDFEKTISWINEQLEVKKISSVALHHETEQILEQIKKLELSLLGEKTKPPVGY